jgi:hypothetical protein
MQATAPEKISSNILEGLGFDDFFVSHDQERLARELPRPMLRPGPAQRHDAASHADATKRSTI